MLFALVNDPPTATARACLGRELRWRDSPQVLREAASEPHHCSPSLASEAAELCPFVEGATGWTERAVSWC